MPVIESNLLSLLANVAAVLAQHKCKSYVVGGFVRDWVLGRNTADVDIAVCGNVLEIAPRVAEGIGGKYVLLDEANRVARVVVIEGQQSWHLDFVSFSDGIEDDLVRRDFTINAMAMDLHELACGSVHLIDPFGGGKRLE